MPGTRSTTQSTDEKQNISTRRHCHENSYIFLMKDEVFQSENEPTILTLTHPRYNKKTKYLHDSERKKLYEILSFEEPYRSWFIGESVKSDGKLHLSTPIDPIFLVIPLLQKHSSNKAMPLEDLLSSSQDDNFKHIYDSIGDLSCVADPKGSPDLKAYKYNSEKTIEWLENKVKRVAKVLKAKRIHVKPGAIAETFIASEKDADNADEDLYMKYAHGIVSEYLQVDLSELLEKKFNFKPEVIESLSSKRKSQQALDTSQNDENESKKIKEDDEVQSNFFAAKTISPNVAKPVKTPMLSSKEKARQKAASGTKSISSFFTKK